MGYRIYYGPKKKKKSLWALQAIYAAVICVFCLLCRFCWPWGSEIIQQCLMPNGRETADSIRILITQLENGAPLPDAITVFLEDVFHGSS